ncbi:MAG TPA: TerC family protein [Candidatus Didemnitutus sp.]|nr:TerC family protein [Candidatus Didemnitutus sp.]
MDTPHLQGHWDWLAAILSIIVIDIILAGDNAVVIALAVRKLTGRARVIGTIVGAGAAVLLRIALTAVAVEALSITGLKVAGGALIFWIAVKLLRENTSDDEETAPGKEAHSLRQAVWLIVVADLTMSLDNVLAVAGAARGHLGLMIFGLVVSIPLVIFASNLLARLMDRYPIIVYGGGAVLGYVGAGMILTDPWSTTHFPLSQPLIYAGEAAGAALVLAINALLRPKPSASRP